MLFYLDNIDKNLICILRYSNIKLDDNALKSNRTLCHNILRKSNEILKQGKTQVNRFKKNCFVVILLFSNSVIYLKYRLSNSISRNLRVFLNFLNN